MYTAIHVLDEWMDADGLPLRMGAWDTDYRDIWIKCDEQIGQY